jgi:hypothetical protein
MDTQLQSQNCGQIYGVRQVLTTIYATAMTVAIEADTQSRDRVATYSSRLPPVDVGEKSASIHLFPLPTLLFSMGTGNGL